MAAALIIVAILAFLVILFLISAIKVAREYERGIIFRLGRLLPAPKGPGLFILIPIVDRMVKVDLRTITLNIPPQEVITKDNVPVRVNAVAYFRIVDPKAAIVQIENFMVATSQIAQTTLRSVLGQHVMDELLSEREKINAILQGIIDEATAPWGIKVSIVEVKDVEIPSGMQRAMARQAEAERERRAKVINAEGEFQASERLKDAALVIEEHPIALQLRYLQTLLELGSSQSTTIVFPAPPETLRLPEHGDWTVRVVPNLYPALERQEVVVHSPRHVRSFADLEEHELDLVAEAWRRRREAVPDGYLHALVNEGAEAGASLPHSHSQLAWFGEPPPAVADERGELDVGEVVLERDGLVLGCPPASRLPYELVIAPLDGEPDG